MYENGQKLVHETWQAHRQLAETLHTKLQTVLIISGKEFTDIEGIVVYAGPGSFTGLRIGFSVANTLAYSMDVPIIAASSSDWIEEGTSLLRKGKGSKMALPQYGMPAHVTESKK